MRIDRYRPGALTREQKVLYDEISGGRRSQGRQRFSLVGDDGALEGPFNAMLLAPKVGLALQELGAAIRYGTTLSPRVREGSILLVAAEWDCGFERKAHEPIAADCGLSDEQIREIRSGRTPSGLDEVETAALDVTRYLIEARDLSGDEFAKYSDLLGVETIFELSTLVGYYSILALQLRIFRV